jgi:hypothetical protein
VQEGLVQEGNGFMSVKPKAGCFNRGLYQIGFACYLCLGAESPALLRGEWIDILDAL